MAATCQADMEVSSLQTLVSVAAIIAGRAYLDSAHLAVIEQDFFRGTPSARPSLFLPIINTSPRGSHFRRRRSSPSSARRYRTNGNQENIFPHDSSSHLVLLREGIESAHKGTLVWTRWELFSWLYQLLDTSSTE